MTNSSIRAWRSLITVTKPSRGIWLPSWLVTRWFPWSGRLMLQCPLVRVRTCTVCFGLLCHCGLRRWLRVSSRVLTIYGMISLIIFSQWSSGQSSLTNHMGSHGKCRKHSSAFPSSSVNWSSQQHRLTELIVFTHQHIQGFWGCLLSPEKVHNILEHV